MVANKTSKIDVRFPLEEKERLASMAEKARISKGELLRRLFRGTTLPVYGKHEAIKEVNKSSADLARLGNLFKLAINELSQALNDGRADPDKVEKLIEELARNRREIMRGNQLLQDKVQKL